ASSPPGRAYPRPDSNRTTTVGTRPPPGPGPQRPVRAPGRRSPEDVENSLAEFAWCPSLGCRSLGANAQPSVVKPARLDLARCHSRGSSSFLSKANNYDETGSGQLIGQMIGFTAARGVVESLIYSPCS